MLVTLLFWQLILLRIFLEHVRNLTYKLMSNSSKAQSHATALYTICTVWFFWGFVAASNGVFIPFCKQHFSLTQFQSQLIEFSFYGAYFFGSLALWLYSQLTGVDLLNKWGYKRAIIIGLFVSVVGAVLLIPSVHVGSFAFILGSFFILALGFSLQQVSTQPYIIALGSPETGSHRISLAGAVNNFGTLLGPLAVTVILFGGVANSGVQADIASIDVLYTVLTLLFLGAIALLYFVPLPVIEHNERFEKGFGAFAFPQLILGMIAIFVYVGTEVTIQSNMGELLSKPEFGGLATDKISAYISLFWGSMFIGRATGALSAFSLKPLVKKILTLVVPFLTFGFVMLVNIIKGNDVSGFYLYAIPVGVLAVAFLLCNDRPFTTLIVFSSLGFLAIGIGLTSTGSLALYSFISGGLFCSILWPCIFPTGIAGLGKYTNQGAGFLIMMILGGAILPPLQGALADGIGIHISYIVPLIGFGYLLFYGFRVKIVLSKQGLDFDSMQAGGGH